MANFKTPLKKKMHETDDQLTIPPSPFLNRLGYGTGVSVMQLVRSPKAGQIRSPWALKMINKRTKPNKVFTERIQAEADLLRRMSHPNIVGFRAFGEDKILYLGMEACDMSLGDIIEKKVEEENYEPFTQKQMLKVTADIGSAMHYLHTKMQILHGDMKSYNILVNGNFVICKLCDFGVTLPLDENGVFDKSNHRKLAYYGTDAWSAPEVLSGEAISDRTDIWAFGLTLFELMALSPPHLPPEDQLDETVMSLEDSYCSEPEFSAQYGTRPAVPSNITTEEYGSALALFYCCTETSPQLRPSAEHLSLAAVQMMDKSDRKGDQKCNDH